MSLPSAASIGGLTGAPALFVIAVGVLAATAAVYILLQLDPVWPFCAAIVASLFSGNWANVGLPVPLDRVLFAVGLASLLLHSRRREAPPLETRAISVIDGNGRPTVRVNGVWHANGDGRMPIPELRVGIAGQEIRVPPAGPVKVSPVRTHRRRFRADFGVPADLAFHPDAEYALVTPGVSSPPPRRGPVAVLPLRAGDLEVRAVHIVLLIATALVVGSAVWNHTLHGQTLFALLDRFGVVPFVMFTVSPLVFKGERERRILLAVLVAIAAYLGLTSLFETIPIRALVLPKYILNPDLGIHDDRARGPFLEAVANGSAVYAGAVAAVIGSRLFRTERMRRISLLVALLCVGDLLFTLTRSVWLAAVVATAVTLVSFRGLRRYVVPVAVGGALFVAVALAFVPGLAAKVHSRQSDQGPLYDRYNSDNAALRMVAARPLLGFGWGMFGEKSGQYYRIGNYPLTTVAEVHNTFLSNAAEIGVLGTIVWLIGLLMAVGGAIVRRGPPELRPWRIGLVAVAVSWLVVANSAPFDNAFPNLLLWLWAGVVMSGVWRMPAGARRTAHVSAAAPVPATA